MSYYQPYLLIVEVLHLQRFDDVSDELRMDVGVADFCMEQLPYRTLRFGADFLRFVADVQARTRT